MMKTISRRWREQIETGDFMDTALVLFMLAFSLAMILLVAAFFVDAWFCTCEEATDALR